MNNIEYIKQWQKEHPEKLREYQVTYKYNARLKALRAIISEGVENITGEEEIKCINCGCDDVEFLEINHINGGGSKEKKSLSSTDRVIRDRIRRGRTVKDLNILCRPCNAVDHLKRIYSNRNKFPSIFWGGNYGQ